MVPDCSRECLLKKISWGSMPPNPPSKLTAAPLDRQISVFMGNTQSHPCIMEHITMLLLYNWQISNGVTKALLLFSNRSVIHVLGVDITMDVLRSIAAEIEVIHRCIVI